MKQLIENRYIGAKVGDTIGVVDRRGFITPDEGGGKNTGVFLSKIHECNTLHIGEIKLEVWNNV